MFLPCKVIFTWFKPIWTPKLATIFSFVNARYVLLTLDSATCHADPNNVTEKENIYIIIVC